MLGLTREEASVLRQLSTPQKIQSFLDSLPMNHEKGGETLCSPRRVLREGRAHCIEGALVAAAALWLQGKKPLIMDLTAKRPDYDHVVALYKAGRHWGAISKTNHAVLRFRDPIYRSPRELALSYFHEYFLNDTGEKTLVSHSGAFDLRTLGEQWITAEEDIWEFEDILAGLPHHPLVPKSAARHIRPASPIERTAGALIEWKESDRGT